ncbi:MAG: ECF-type riboflavin transporter substrate-binding protein [Fusobacteriaceae bacterium]
MFKFELTTKKVVAIGIGAALYSVLSAVMIPIGPNTSLRIAVAILTIFGVMFGPVVGFLVGFIGHSLNDMIMWGSVWFSWVFLSAIIGLFAGFIKYNKAFNLEKGIVPTKSIVLMYLYALIGMIMAGIIAYIGDVYFYGEPAEKVFIQIILASLSNFAITAIVGIPAILAIAKKNKKHSNLSEE